MEWAPIATGIRPQSADDIAGIAERGFRRWHAWVYDLHRAEYADAVTTLRYANPQIDIYARLPLFRLGDWAGRAAHPTIYWQHERWRQRALGMGWLQDGAERPIIGRGGVRMASAYADALIELIGPLLDARAISGVWIDEMPVAKGWRQRMTLRLVLWRLRLRLGDRALQGPRKVSANGDIESALAEALIERVPVVLADTDAVPAMARRKPVGKVRHEVEIDGKRVQIRDGVHAIVRGGKGRVLWI